MDQSIPVQLTPKPPKYYKSVCAQLLAEMSRLEEQMDKDSADRERLTAEIQIIKAETEVIKARTDATLSRLQEYVDNLSRAA